MGSLQGEAAGRTGNILIKAGAVVGVGVVGLAAMKGVGIDVPFPSFDGGEPDHAPKGTVIYEGQVAESATTEFVMPIGNGTARVRVEAKQNWDRHGSVLNGDWQGTNGHAEVSNPDDRDQPAMLKIGMDYAADGMITITPEVDDEGRALADERTGELLIGKVTYDMGNLWVTGADFKETPENEAAFQQDDTPADFQGEFESFVKSATEDVALASDSSEALEEYTSPEYLAFVRQRVADEFGVPLEKVEVIAGEVGESDAATKRDLRERLESYANKQDPDDPDKEYKSLDVAYLGSEEGVSEANYLDLGAQDLQKLSEVEEPDLTPEEEGSSSTSATTSRVPQ